MRQGHRPIRQRGMSFLELILALAASGLLALAGIRGWDAPEVDLAAAHLEIRGSVEQAFALARARGTNVTVALGQKNGAGEHLPVLLSPRVKWGKPARIPLPPGMDAPVVAATTGEAHPLITVTPRGTALASAWFLHNGQEALCMRLSGRGQLQVLRWRQDRQKWTRL